MILNFVLDGALIIVCIANIVVRLMKSNRDISGWAFGLLASIVITMQDVNIYIK